MDPLEDINVNLWPKCLWKIYERTGLVEFMPGLISLGFIRVCPRLTLLQVRGEITRQLGTEFPLNYHFLKQVGRKMAIVKRRQEDEISAQDFLPPSASSPDMYVVEDTTVEIGSQYSQSRNVLSAITQEAEKISSINDGHLPPIPTKPVKSENLREKFENVPERLPQIVQSPSLANHSAEGRLTSNSVQRARRTPKSRRRKPRKRQRSGRDSTNAQLEAAQLDSFMTVDIGEKSKKSVAKNLDEFGREKKRSPKMDVIESQLDTFNDSSQVSTKDMMDPTYEESDSGTEYRRRVRKGGKTKQNLAIKQSGQKHYRGDSDNRASRQRAKEDEWFNSYEKVTKMKHKLSRVEKKQIQSQLEQIKQLEEEMDKARHDILNHSEEIDKVKSNHGLYNSSEAGFGGNQDESNSSEGMGEDNRGDVSEGDEGNDIRINPSKGFKGDIEKFSAGSEEDERMDPSDDLAQKSRTQSREVEERGMELKMERRLRKLQIRVEEDEAERNYLIGKLEGMKKHKTRESHWKTKYLEEKKSTSQLEEEIERRENALNRIYNRKPQNSHSVSQNKKMKPGYNTNMMIIKMNLEQEIDKLAREEELVKARLSLQMKIKNQESDRAGKNRDILRQYRYEVNDHRHRYVKILGGSMYSPNIYDFTLPKLK